MGRQPYCWRGDPPSPSLRYQFACCRLYFQQREVNKNNVLDAWGQTHSTNIFSKNSIKLKITWLTVWTTLLHVNHRPWFQRLYHDIALKMPCITLESHFYSFIKLYYTYVSVFKFFLDPRLPFSILSTFFI
jgi:hypothetical protein